MTWTLEYNDLNQLTQRYTGPSWGGSVSGEERWAYAYDANGNFLAATQETYNGSVWSESEALKILFQNNFESGGSTG